MAVPRKGSGPQSHEFRIPTRFRPVGSVVVEDGIGSCEAHDAIGGQDVLLRFAPTGPEDTSSARSSIPHEYRVLSHLSHPSIPRVLGLVLEPSCSCLCLESGRGYYELPGWPDARWSAERFRIWLDSLLSMLDYIHGMGLVHRNLTPATVTVPTESGSQQSTVLRVTGFHRSAWLSDTVSSRLSPSGFFFPSSESPQIPGPSLDLFSVGALAAYVLSGELGTEADDSPDALSVLNRSLRPVPEYIMKVLRRMVASEESVRPSSVAEVRSQLRDGEAVRMATRAIVCRPMTECGLVPRRSMTRLLRAAIARSREGTRHILALVGPRGAGKTQSGRIAEVEARINGCGFVSCCRVAPAGGDGVVLSEKFHSIARGFEREDADFGHGGSSLGDGIRTDSEPDRKRILLFADDADKLAKEDLVALVDVVSSEGSERVLPLLVLACRDLPVDLLRMKGVRLVTGGASGSESGAAGIPIYVRPIGDLSRQETAQLISDTTCRTPSPRFVDWMISRAAGNPLFTRELIAHLTAHEHLRESSRGLELKLGAETVVLPESITSVLHERARRLSPNQLRVAEVMSLGPGATPAAIAEITSLSRAAVDEVTRTLIRCGVLRPGNPADEQAFSHELLRDVIYEGIPAPDRKQLHEKVAEIWKRMADVHPSDAQRNRVLAWHLFRGHNPRTAAECALNAVMALTRDGRTDESVRYLHILETLPIDALDADAGSLGILMCIAQDYWQLGRATCCARACEFGIALASSRDCAEQPVPLEFTTLLAKAYVLSGDLGRASQILEDVLPEVERRADPALLVKTYYGLCMIRQMSGMFAEMARLSEQCFAASERSVDSDVVLLGYCARANSLIALCEWEASKDWYLDAAEIQRSTNRRRALATTLGNLGRAHMFLGEWSSADDYLEQSSALARELACEYSLGLNFGNYAQLQMRRGALGAAARSFREAMAHAELAGDDWGLASVLSDLGELEHLRGNNQAALELFARSEELMEQAGAVDDLPELQRRKAESLMATGRRAVAEELAGVARNAAEEMGNRLEAANCLRVLGQLAADSDEAVRLLEDAIGRLRALGAPYELNQTLQVLGRVLLGAGQHDAAVEGLAEARDGF